MESSIAVFLKRQLACELLPTCGLDHVGRALAFAGVWEPWCLVAATLPVARGQATYRPSPPSLMAHHHHRHSRTCRVKHTHLAR